MNGAAAAVAAATGGLLPRNGVHQPNHPSAANLARGTDTASRQSLARVARVARARRIGGALEVVPIARPIAGDPIGAASQADRHGADHQAIAGTYDSEQGVWIVAKTYNWRVVSEDG